MPPQPIPATMNLHPPRKKSKKTMSPFKAAHVMRYGLQPTSWDATGAVTSAKCRFCDVFKREERESMPSSSKPRKRSDNVKFFRTFRTTCYKQHLDLEHPVKWAEYQNLTSDEDREVFFGPSRSIPLVNSLHAHFDVSAAELAIRVKPAVVETIIGRLLFHPDDFGGMARERALHAFQCSCDPSGNITEYKVTIKNQKRFFLVVGFIARGASFRMAVDFVQNVRDETGLSVYTGCTDTIVSNHARALCAASLQILSGVLEAASGFSMALDTSTIHEKSYLDIRVRFAIRGFLYNFHLMALPLFQEHTGEQMFSTTEIFMNAVAPQWKNILVGVSTDGESSSICRQSRHYSRNSAALL